MAKTKMKTRRAAAKRFRLTGTGKIRRRQSHRSHLLEHKSSERKNRLGHLTLVHKSDEDNVRKMIPYKK